MGLVPFLDKRVGFWIAGRPERALEEVPEGLVPQVLGEVDPAGEGLVVVGADAAGVPEWAVVVHASRGAVLLLPWEGRLLVALGEWVLLVEPTGAVAARHRIDAGEWVTAWPVGEGRLLLLTRDEAHLFEGLLTPRWKAALGDGQFQLLSHDDGVIRLAQLGSGEDWDVVALDTSSGAVLGRDR